MNILSNCNLPLRKKNTNWMYYRNHFPGGFIRVPTRGEVELERVRYRSPQTVFVTRPFVPPDRERKESSLPKPLVLFGEFPVKIYVGRKKKERGSAPLRFSFIVSCSPSCPAGFSPPQPSKSRGLNLPREPRSSHFARFTSSFFHPSSRFRDLSFVIGLSSLIVFPIDIFFLSWLLTLWISFLPISLFFFTRSLSISFVYISAFNFIYFFSLFFSLISASARKNT